MQLGSLYYIVYCRSATYYGQWISKELVNTEQQLWTKQNKTRLDILTYPPPSPPQIPIDGDGWGDDDDNGDGVGDAVE